MYTWQTNIQYVKGVGPATAAKFNQMGIETVGDLLEHKPNYHIYPGVTSIKDAKQGRVIIKAKIMRIYRTQAQVPTVEAVLSDGTGTCYAKWWNQVFVVQHLHAGMRVVFWGKYCGNVLQQPKFSTVAPDMNEVAGGDYGSNTGVVRKALREVLDNERVTTLPIDIENLFRMYHFPSTKNTYKYALNCLKYQELLLMQLALAKKRQRQTKRTLPTLFGIKPNLFDPKVRKYFPYNLTAEQNFVILEIIHDMCGDSPMNRLLQGDVGCGKTAVAFYAAMLTALNNKRAIILCPTTVLASQHFDTLWNMGWKDLCLYCAGEENQRADWYKGKIIIGTHAILNNESLIKSASLVIIDEFQKFGVEQRAKVQQYGAHLLLMSATPIPRTLAMTTFGDLDISTIKEYPIKRGTVVTRWVHPDKRCLMYDLVERELSKGKQAYIVYPRIESGDEDIVSAEKGFEQIGEHFSYPSCLLTGRASQEDKTKALQLFKSGKTRILVSTIIAEVGLDNPNATVMVIEGADRFGLNQLHQLRGRVCRSTDTVFCFLVAKTTNETSIARLKVMEACNDGFEIAEQDLRLRGPGEMFSTRQHGLPDLKFASLLDDYDLLIKARDKANEIIDRLDEPEYAGVKQVLEIKYGDSLRLGEVI